jgi:hypothetical protein
MTPGARAPSLHAYQTPIGVMTMAKQNLWTGTSGIFLWAVHSL